MEQKIECGGEESGMLDYVLSSRLPLLLHPPLPFPILEVGTAEADADDSLGMLPQELLGTTPGGVCLFSNTTDSKDIFCPESVNHGGARMKC